MNLVLNLPLMTLADSFSLMHVHQPSSSLTPVSKMGLCEVKWEDRYVSLGVLGVVLWFALLCIRARIINNRIT